MSASAPLTKAGEISGENQLAIGDVYVLTCFCRLQRCSQISPSLLPPCSHGLCPVCNSAWSPDRGGMPCYEPWQSRDWIWLMVFSVDLIQVMAWALGFARLLLCQPLPWDDRGWLSVLVPGGGWQKCGAALDFRSRDQWIDGSQPADSQMCESSQDQNRRGDPQRIPRTPTGKTCH